MILRGVVLRKQTGGRIRPPLVAAVRRRLRLAFELGPNALDLIAERLRAINAGSQLEAGVYPRGALAVNRFMTGFDRCHHGIPIAFHIRAVGMHLWMQPRGVQDALAGRNIGGDRDPHPNGNQADFNVDVHAVDCWIGRGTSLPAPVLSLKSLIAYGLRILRLWFVVPAVLH